MTVADRFWSKVDVKGPNECWPWTAAINTSGYGWFGINGKNRGAHRVVMEMEHGPLPDGLCALHHCDNRPCCNPNHLYIGTKRNNAEDRVNRGHEPDRRGVINVKAKLTEEQVLEIRSAPEIGKALADRFGLSRSQAWAVKHGRFWKHVLEVN